MHTERPLVGVVGFFVENAQRPQNRVPQNAVPDLVALGTVY